jgi:hypothetical protein
VVADRGLLYVFHRGTNNRVYYTYLAGHSWSPDGWREVPPTGATTLSAIGATFERITGVLILAIRGMDNRIYATLMRQGNWSPQWDFVGDGKTISTPTPFIRPGTSEIALLAGIVVAGLDGRVYTTLSRKFSWGGYTQGPGDLFTSQTISALSIPATVYLFAVGSGDTLWEQIYIEADR